jgi:hypothetical protein
LKEDAEAPATGLAPLLLWAALASMAWSFCSLGLRPVVRGGDFGGRLLMGLIFSWLGFGFRYCEGFGILLGDGDAEGVEELSGAAVGDLASGDAVEDFEDQSLGGGLIVEIGWERLGLRARLVEAAEGLVAKGGSAAGAAVGQCLVAERDDCG